MNAAEVCSIALLAGSVGPVALFCFAQHHATKFARQLATDAQVRCPFCKRTGAVTPLEVHENVHGGSYLWPALSQQPACMGCGCASQEGYFADGSFMCRRCFERDSK